MSIEILENDYSHIAKARKLFIQHPDAKKCSMKIRDAYYSSAVAEEPKNYMIVGSTGVGKTTIIRSIEREFGPIVKEDRVEYPVLSISVPSKPTIKNVAEEILISMGDPLYSRGGSTEKTQRIIDFVGELNIKMLIFDEMQHFVDGGHKNAPREVADWLKRLIDRSNSSTILVGTGPVTKILDSNDQLRRRYSSIIHLKPFSVRDDKSAKEFASVIRYVDDALGLPERFDYMDLMLLESMYYATNGIMDYIVKLLIQAYEISKARKETRITRSTLETAFTEAVWVEGVGRMNPFSMKFINRALDFKRGMPFAA